SADGNGTGYGRCRAAPIGRLSGEGVLTRVPALTMVERGLANRPALIQPNASMWERTTTWTGWRMIARMQSRTMSMPPMPNGPTDSVFLTVFSVHPAWAVW